MLGAGAEKKASRNAQAAEVDALNKAIGVQQANLAQTRGDLAPEFALGNSAIGEYGDLTGANGTDKWTTALSALKDSPIYQSLFRNGLETNLQNASATGGLRGGNEQRGLADFGADTLSATLQQRLQQLMASIGIGTQAKGVAAGVGMNTANQSSAFNTQIGNANAQGDLTRGGLTAGMWNSAGSFLDQAMSAALGAAGGGAGAAGGSGGFASLMKNFF